MKSVSQDIFSNQLLFTDTQVGTVRLRYFALRWLRVPSANHTDCDPGCSAAWHLHRRIVRKVASSQRWRKSQARNTANKNNNKTNNNNYKSWGIHCRCPDEAAKVLFQARQGLCNRWVGRWWCPWCWWSLLCAKLWGCWPHLSHACPGDDRGNL